MMAVRAPLCSGRQVAKEPRVAANLCPTLVSSTDMSVLDGGVDGEHGVDGRT